MFGRSCRGPVKILKEVWTNEFVEGEVKDVNTFMLELREKIEEHVLWHKRRLDKLMPKISNITTRRQEIGNWKSEINFYYCLPSFNNKLLVQWQGP